MNLIDFLDEKSILVGMRATGKRHLFTQLASYIEKSFDIGRQSVYPALARRENIGVTAMKGGVAFPHCVLSNIKKAVFLFVCLETPVDFENGSDKVDILLLALLPEEQEIKRFRWCSQAIRILEDAELCAALRACRDREEVLDVFHQNLIMRVA